MLNDKMIRFSQYLVTPTHLNFGFRPDRSLNKMDMDIVCCIATPNSEYYTSKYSSRSALQ